MAQSKPSKAVRHGRRAPKQARSQIMVEAILEATQQLLASIGYENTNTTRIAERAGVSIGSLYQYFPNRDAVIAELQRRHHKETSAILTEAFAKAEDLPLEEAVRHLVQATIRLHQLEPELHRVLTEIVPASVNLESRAALYQVLATAQRRWFHTIARQVQPKDLDVSGLIIRELVEGATHAAVIHGDADKVAAVGDELTTMIVAYLRAQPSVAAPAIAAQNENLAEIPKNGAGS